MNSQHPLNLDGHSVKLQGQAQISNHLSGCYRSVIASSSKNNSKNIQIYKLENFEDQKKRINKFLQHFVTSKLFKVNFNDFLLKKQKLRISVFERRTLFFQK
jgi:regulator of sirC expression with transglutaminase-like and TPR domain